MSSILKVNTIQDTDGNNIINENANVITIGASGDTITVPAGATVSGFTSAGIDDNATSTAITISSDEDVTFTEDILLGDSKKAIFGAGSDLEIFHNGTNSYISDNGTGDLYIRGSADIRFTNPSATENYAIFNDNGAVDLYYDNAKKFETTSDGVAVTGGQIRTSSSSSTLSIQGGSTYPGAKIQLAGGQASSNPGTIIFLADDGNVTNVTERARIDDDGNLLVGTTSSSLNSVGFRAFSGGNGIFTKDGAQALILNRQTSDGDILKLYKDGTAVGSIGNLSADFSVTNATATNGAGISLQNNLFVTPMKGGSKDTGSNVSLGNTSYTWKDLYLGGGVYLGGTGTANKLDDYEEGTFTPSFSNTNGFSNLSYTNQQGYYTKIGQLVNVRIRIQLASGTTKNGNRIIMDGLPFTSANTTGTGNGLYWQYVDDQIIGSNTTNVPILWIANNSSAVNLYKTDGGNFTGNDTSGSTTSMDFYFTGSYTTS